MSFRKLSACALAAALLIGSGLSSAFAHSVEAGSLSLTDLWTRATPPGAPTGAGYLTITNHGTEPDRLVSASTPSAEKGEIHEMTVKDGVMTMRPIDKGVEIPAGGSITLAPGGFHLMFTGLKESFADGGKLPVTLTFEKAGTVETFLHIMPIGSKGPGGAEGHDGHEGHMSHEEHTQ